MENISVKYPDSKPPQIMSVQDFVHRQLCASANPEEQLEKLIECFTRLMEWCSEDNVEILARIVTGDDDIEISPVDGQ